MVAVPAQKIRQVLLKEGVFKGAANADTGPSAIYGQERESDENGDASARSPDPWRTSPA